MDSDLDPGGPKHMDPDSDPDQQHWDPQHYADLDPVAMRAIIISPSYHRKKWVLIRHFLCPKGV
jgi:hypothetical protein